MIYKSLRELGDIFSKDIHKTRVIFRKSVSIGTLLNRKPEYLDLVDENRLGDLSILYKRIWYKQIGSVVSGTSLSVD